ncbi:MSMEG_0570 family nitrogen starvation response protein [Puerhibacterium puerhi]|uniref:MSMEG_0570 family nitrogen starvation response protein n=1 Tax=Puerhibacterium puerhi TaxID=2692623 RepID=UPI0013588C54|nr:MSMEG_0570 family nitrogen starvation response protein [Puerhibacterium puerhi]
MPEMTFEVRWPDGTDTVCYSPSLVMWDHLEVGARYPVSDFVERSARALGQASERVRARYGVACTSAMAQEAEIREVAARYADDGEVQVLRMAPPLPAAQAATAATGGAA